MIERKSIIILHNDESEFKKHDLPQVIKHLENEGYYNIEHNSIKMTNFINPIRSFLYFIHSKLANLIFSIKPERLNINYDIQSWKAVEILTYECDKYNDFNFPKLSSKVAILSLNNTTLFKSNKQPKCMAMFNIYKKNDKTKEETSTWWEKEHAPILLEKQKNMKFQYYVQSMVTNSKSFNLDNYSAPEFIAFLGYKINYQCF